MDKDLKTTTVDAYIASFPKEVAERMEMIRKVIKDTVPEAEEKISYAIPTYALKGNLVHFMGAKNHIGFYPGPSGILAFASELESYKGGKGTIQLPHHEPLPLELIQRITYFRVIENLEKATSKK